MALGTPVAAAAAYSAASGTSVSPAYPAGILATDAVLLFVGMKPTAVAGGTVTTPTGWTLQDSLTNAGGYAAQGADTGNSNLYVYTWNTPVAGQTGNLAVTLAGNNVTWAFMVRVPSGGGALSYGSADGQRTTTPTSPMSIALTNGATATNFASGDRAIWAMCIPTDVTTPSQFSAQSITATGATFGTATELNEPDSTTGNDIGGYSAWAAVTAGSSTTAPTVTATLAGTLTNVRGPVVLVRVREAAPAPITGTLAATETGSDTFAATGDTVVKGSLSATETGSDTFAATGTVSDPAITGTMAATETGSDTFTGTGDVVVKGSLTATEVGKDTFVAVGDVVVRGSLTASETGKDTLAATGDVFVKGSLAATESGPDIFAATGTVSGGAVISGTMAAVETGSDAFASSGVVKVAGQMSATESGQDVAGAYVLEGYVEPGYYLEPWIGRVLVAGTMAASESGSDIFYATGTVNPTPTPSPERGDGVGRRWKKRELRERDRKLEQEKLEKNQLRKLIEQAIDPVKEEKSVKVVRTEAAVAVVPKSGPAIAIQAPVKFDTKAIAAEVTRALNAIGVEAKRARDAESKRIAAEAFRVAEENVRARVKRKRDDEFLLLM